MAPRRRIASVVLPRFLCEIASWSAVPVGGATGGEGHRPFGVVLIPSSRDSDLPLSEQTPLNAVNEEARRLGLRPGLSMAEAHAFVSSLEVRVLEEGRVREALASVAEIALAFGPTSALSPPDAVLLDLTGAAHLRGSEEMVAGELRARVGKIGHFAQVAIAGGPRIATAVARHAHRPISIVPPGHDATWLRKLPISSLPIDDDTACWLLRVGMVTVGDLAQLPREQVVARIADPEVLSLLDGHDTTPLRAYEPPRVLKEEASWEDGIEQQSALLFVLNRLSGNLAARLEGRGEAASVLVLTIYYDRSIAKLRGAAEAVSLRMDLPAPLCRERALLRTVRARLERCQLEAPALGLTLEATVIVRSPHVQLDLSRDVAASPDALPVLLAELSADIGDEHVGTLRLVDSYRPEARSCLQPALAGATRATESPLAPALPVSRLLRAPLPLGWGPLSKGQHLTIPQLPAFEVDGIEFDARLDDVFWWTATPIHRDYVNVWMRASRAGGSAWIYLDRKTGGLFLHGWVD